MAETIDNVSVRRIQANALLNGTYVGMRRVHAAVDHRDNDTRARASRERRIGEVEALLQTEAFTVAPA